MHRVNDFNYKFNIHLDNTNFVHPGEDIDFYYPNNVYDIPIKEHAENGENVMNKQPADADDRDSYDKLIGATFLLDPLKSLDNVETRATVTRRETDHQGKPTGRAHPNPLLNTCEYEVQRRWYIQLLLC